MEETKKPEVKEQKVEEKKEEKATESISKPKQDETSKSKESEKSELKPISDTKKTEPKKEDKKEEKAVKKEEKKPEPEKGPKKTETVVNGKDLRISTKHAVAVCNFVRNKNIDLAMNNLEQVGKMKIAIPMRGEIPHKKGMMSGRYPLKAVAEFMRLLKSLRSNAIFHDLELEKVKISCMANVAARPYRRGGQKRFKRTHVQIKLIHEGKK